MCNLRTTFYLSIKLIEIIQGFINVENNVLVNKDKS